MSIIVKKQKKKDRGYNFKIMNRDVDDPLYHDPNVPNKVLIHAPTRSEMKEFKKNKNREVPEYLQTINESYDVSGFDPDKDQIDYAYDEFHKKVEEQMEAEGEDYEIDAEGDEEYEFMGFNNKADKEFTEDIKQNFQYKPAEGVKFVEYDAFGLPKTEEIQKMKQEMNLKDEEVFKEDGTQVLFIKPPEEYKLHGYHKNVDIERKDMDQEMREVYDMMEEVDGEVIEDVDGNDCIDDDFLGMLNENQPALVQKQTGIDQEECKVFDELGELAGEEDEAIRKAKEEAEQFMKNMPMGLSEEMQMRLAGAREHLANKNANKEIEEAQNNEIKDESNLDNEFTGLLDEYQDNDIGAVDDDMMDPLGDLIDQEAFDEIMQEFIEGNKDTCKKLYTQYHDEDFATKIVVDGEGIEEITAKDDKMREKVYKHLKQKNGEIVRLVPKEEMQKLHERMNADEYEARRKMIKEKIIKFNQRILEEEALEGELEDVREVDEDEEEQQKWDVETILTTRTNTDNHPGLIKTVVKPKKNKIKIDPKTKAPELEIEYVKAEDKNRSKPSAYVEEILSEEESDEEIEMDTEELNKLEGMNEKEKKKYLRKINKKQVKKDRKERRKMKKEMKKEFSKNHQKYIKYNTVAVGEIRPGVSVRKM